MPDASSNACCPRCGYDQRGVVSQWTNCCDLFTTCSECGLTIDWCQQLSSRHQIPGWCVEARRSWRCFSVQTLETLVMVLVPGVFWRQVRMNHQLHWLRLGLFIAMLLVLTYIVFALCHGRIAVRWMDELMWVTPGNWTDGVFWKATLLPFSDSILTDFVNATPRDVVRDYAPLFPTAVASMISVLLLFVLMPAGFMFLPISRRRARVQWRHIWRISLYSVVIPFMAFVYVDLRAASTEVGRASAWSIQLEALWLFPHVLVPTLIFLWWGFAISRYLLMEHPWTVTSALFILAAIPAGSIQVWLQLRLPFM